MKRGRKEGRDRKCMRGTKGNEAGRKNLKGRGRGRKFDCWTAVREEEKRGERQEERLQRGKRGRLS